MALIFYGLFEWQKIRFYSSNGGGLKESPLVDGSSGNLVTLNVYASRVCLNLSPSLDFETSCRRLIDVSNYTCDCDKRDFDSSSDLACFK